MKGSRTMIPRTEQHSLRSLIFWIVATISIPAFHPAIVHAQATSETSVSKTETAQTPGQFKPEEQASKGSVTVDGNMINYDAHAGTIIVHPKGWDDVPQNNTDKDPRISPPKPACFTSPTSNPM